MRRLNVERFSCIRRDPAVQNTPAWEFDRMNAAGADRGQFEIAVKRRHRGALPIHALTLAIAIIEQDPPELF